MDVTQHKSAISDTFDRAAADFDRSPVDFFTPLGRRLVARAELRPGERILDLGCGRGACTFPAREAVGPDGSVTGVDIAPAMVRHTAAEAAERGWRNVTVRHMDAESPQFAPESFDAVLGGFSVMHLPGAPDVLGAYLPLLVPGGRLVYSDLVDEDGLPPFVPPAAFAVLAPHFPPGPDPRERGRAPWSDSAESISSALTRLGFTEVAVTEEAHEMSVGSGADWITWTMSTGLRAAWDNLRGADALAARRRIEAVFDERRGPDGRISLPVVVRFVHARRPSGPGAAAASGSREGR
ncbi:class I SAM-dependent methyltransferase [Streptomyces sp. enrichment culture]|uniref:class I SAM-dependent methyltransferase n=1 Tax=Streptomyces sp. enrichment culture TaxID=1795815 RepID=UPI003F566336